MPKKMAGMEPYHEYSLVQQRVALFVSENDHWPNSLTEAGYLSKERQVNLDLSEPWVLLGKINNKVLNEEVVGRQIKFTLNPETNKWHCDSSVTDLPALYLPTSCGGSANIYGNLSLQTWSFLAAVTAFIIIILLAVFRHPLLKLMRSNNFKLEKVKYVDLKQLDFLSRITGHRTPLLKSNGLTLSEWQQITTIRNSKPISTIKVLSRMLPIESIKTEGKLCCRLMLSDQFELNLTALLLVVSAEEKSIRIIRELNQLEDQSTPILLWLNNAEAHKHVRLQRGQINRPCLIPSQQEMTQLMVFSTAREALIKLASSQLPINSISPYQGKGGIIKSSHFFGRQAMLDKLESQIKMNFLLVGGRQLGKTSLLKALYRKLNQTPSCYCLYISMSDDRLMPRLTYHSGIKDFTDLSDMMTQLKNKHVGKRIRILIDEADLFIQSEIDGGFELMDQIRTASEQGLCQFVFAGFWKLYASAVLDYHSPLRNLAETITVGPLDSGAAFQLINQPMTMLRQQFESPELIQDIYQQTGGRANLINIICEHLVEQLAVEKLAVEQLASGKKIINSFMIKEAYQSDRVVDAMLGWSNLTSDVQACALDRTIVYVVFMHHEVNLHVINEILGELGINLNPEQLKQSIQRLRLAHILTKKTECYQFAVPLFAMLHDRKEAQVLLTQEVQYLKS